MTPTTAPPSDLARLLGTERRLEERLRAARADAEGVVAQAEQAAAAEEAALDAQLADAARALDASLDAEGRRRSTEIADAADRKVQAYDRVTPAKLVAVAKALAERFLVGETA